jgi:NAD(P)-dependent dehydrogenase (short-subunit alcohol dehydrogenase family)
MTEKKVWLITGAGRDLGVDIAKAALAAANSLSPTAAMSKVAAAVGAQNNCWALQSVGPLRQVRLSR